MLQALNPSSQETDRQISQAENSLVDTEFQASQGHIVRPCVKTYKPELERCLHKPVSEVEANLWTDSQSMAICNTEAHLFIQRLLYKGLTRY